MVTVPLMSEAVLQMLGRLAVPESREDAARQIVDGYVHRLLPLIRKELGAAVRQRVDPEDVMQSVWRTFFQGDFYASSGNELGALLARLCVNKARDKVRRQTAEKRDVNRTSQHDYPFDSARKLPTAVRPIRVEPGEEAHAEAFVEDDSFFEEESVSLLLSGPTPEQAFVVREAIERLPEHLRAVMVLRLKGLTMTESARELNCTRRTIVRRIALLKAWFREQFDVRAPNTQVAAEDDRDSEVTEGDVV